MADDKINKGEVVVKEGKSAEDSDDSLTNLDLVREMYESIKDIASSTDSIASSTDSKPDKEKRKMESYEKEHDDDYYYGREDLEPDRSKTDYYCNICEAHMNSKEMWESHISGKRHLKNVQKLPGEMPSKVRSIKIRSKPKLLDLIKDISEPIVGLEFMTELQRYDKHLYPSYTCHLCQANCTWYVVVDHILTTKHRLAYIKAVDRVNYEMLQQMGMKSRALDKLAEHQAEEYEEKKGCGEIEVKLEKPKMLPQPPNQEKTYEHSLSRSRSVSSERTIRRSSRHHRSRSPPLRRLSYRSSTYKRSSRSSSEESSPHRHASSPKLKSLDLGRLSTAEKIDLMGKLVQEIHPIPRNLTEKIPGIIINLTTEVLRYKVRQMPLAAQNKLAKYIARDETSKCRRQLTPLVEEIFGNISSIFINKFRH